MLQEQVLLDVRYLTRDDIRLERTSTVRIYAVDGFGDYPVHGAVLVHGEWVAVCWKANGRYNADDSDHKFDLIDREDEYQWDS